nr:TMEM175 family protein [Streptomyces acidipaludis]
MTWVNHHTIFQYIARVDRTLLFLNLMLLMGVAALPWPASVVPARGQGAIASSMAACRSWCASADRHTVTTSCAMPVPLPSSGGLTCWHGTPRSGRPSLSGTTPARGGLIG